jgi:hypothetical protein
VFAQEDAQYSQYNRFRLRTYDNRIGRFLSPDPVVIGPDSGNAESPISGGGGGQHAFGFSRGGGGSDHGSSSGRFGRGPQVEDPLPDEMNTISEGDPPRNVLDFTGYVIDGMIYGTESEPDYYDEWGAKVNFGLGLGWETTFGSCSFILMKSNLYKYSYVNGELQTDREPGITFVEGTAAVPLINAGASVSINNTKPIFRYKLMWLGANYGNEGFVINNNFSYHFGVVGAEVYQTTDDIWGYLFAYPLARQSNFDEHGFMIPMR